MANKPHAEVNERRRRYLKLLGGTSAAITFSGCLSEDGDGSSNDDINDSDSDGNGNAETNDSDSSDSEDEPALRYIQESLPTEGQYNPYNPNNQFGIFTLYDELGTWVPETDSWESFLAEDWSFADDQTTLEVTLRDDQLWHNEEEILAEDLRTKWRIEYYYQHPMWEQIDELEIVEDKTLAFHFNESVNEFVTLASLIHGVTLDTPRFIFGEYLEALEDASSEEEENDALANLTEFALPMDEVVGNSPWRVVQVDENGSELEIWDGHPAKDELNFEKVQVPYITSENKTTAILEDEVDYVNADTIGPDMQDQVESADTILRYGGGFDGVTVSVNHDHEWFSRRNVRKAIAYILDGEIISANPLRVVEDNYDAGISLTDETAPDQLPNIHDSLENYTYDEEEATSLLEEEGFYQDGGTWMTPNDEPFTIEGPWPEAGPNPSRAEAMNALLSDFGIETEIQVIETGTWSSRLEECDYDLTHGFYMDINPFNAYQAAFIDGVNPRPSCSNEPKREYTIPWPPGNPDNDLETIDAFDRLNQLPTATGDEATEVLEELAWIFNQGLPQIPIMRTALPMAFRADEWEWPEEDDPLWQIDYPPTQLPLLGYPEWTG